MSGTGPLVIVARIELTSILRRLEAATSRLEDMASSVVETPKTNGTTAAGTVPAAVPRAAPAPAEPKKVAEPVPQIIEDFDSFIATTVKKYVSLSKEIGGVVADQVRSLNTDHCAKA